MPLPVENSIGMVVQIQQTLSYMVQEGQKGFFSWKKKNFFLNILIEKTTGIHHCPRNKALSKKVMTLYRGLGALLKEMV